MFYIQKRDTFDFALQSKGDREPADVSSDVEMEGMMQTGARSVRKQRSGDRDDVGLQI